MLRNNNNKDCILVVDDAPDTIEVLSRNLRSKGFTVLSASSVHDAVRILDSSPVDLVITDYRMPKVSGLDLVKHVRGNFKNTEIIMITGYPSIEGAVEAVKTGAEEYLVKPFTDDELFQAVQIALDKLYARRLGCGELTVIPASSYGFIGQSEAMNKILQVIPKAASTTATVLITGESGTGKELIARAIHYHSPRASAPFVPVNCGGIPDGLIESELFGHVKGAFTGANESRAGFFQTADGGTIFLDEISEVSQALQVKLLRVLQDKKVYMVGSTRERLVDVRIIAATNKDLHTLVKKNLFREDLFFRINVITITMPPLRERNDDVLLLTHYFAEKFSREIGRAVPTFTDEALKLIKNYSWPGNVRELENMIQHLVVMVEEEQIDVHDLPAHMRFYIHSKPEFNRTLSEIEADYIRNVLESVGWNKTRTAEILGIDRKTLREKIKNYYPDISEV